MSSAAYRFPAEWEPQSVVQFTLPHPNTDWAEMLDELMPCFVAIIEQVVRFQAVLLVHPEPASVRSYFAHLPPDRLHWFASPTNDTWARDHGGITVLQADGSPLLLDFQFNGWGLKFPADQDNQLTARLHQAGVFGDITHVFPGLVLEGGALETDGQGTLLSTTECLLSPNRNPHLSLSATETALRKWLGIDRFLWLHHGYLAGDDTDSHIDTLARFCDPETIAYVRCDDPLDEHYHALRLMEQELETFRQGNGRPYRLVALPWPEACYAADGHRLPATYANFLILNGAVLVPTYGVAQDEAAVAILADCFPDREVIGIHCRALIEQHGSLHCLTMQYPQGVFAGSKLE
ncbi:MAG: agmatine deiminase family protein [Bacteroidetes bacterium]|nr:MAG: agmatine deiminase family protein [Bacteroidota bacterium]